MPDPRRVPAMAERIPAARTGTTAASIVAALGSTASSLLATLCCAGPLAYTALGAGGVLAAARLQPWRPWLLTAAALFLAVGFWSAYRQRTTTIDGQTCRIKTSRTVRTTLWLATILTIAVAVFG